MTKAQVLKYLSGAREGVRGGSKGNVRGGATARESMEKSWSVGIVEGKEVRVWRPCVILKILLSLTGIIG